MEYLFFMSSDASMICYWLSRCYLDALLNRGPRLRNMCSLVTEIEEDVCNKVIVSLCQRRTVCIPLDRFKGVFHVDSK
jgi:hypothetical protein